MSATLTPAPPASPAPQATGPDKSGERVRTMFGEIALRYDFMNHFLSGGVDYYWRWYTVRKATPALDGPILDVCTGTGDLAVAYWNRAGRKLPVTGTDFTLPMLRIARDKTRSLQGQGAALDFLQADTQALPFPSDLFQIVSVAFGLRNVADTRRGLGEMLRVCRPGGQIVVLEFSMPGNPVIRALYSWYFRNILPRLGQLLARNNQSAYNYLPESVGAFPYGKALAQVMTECGMERVSWHPLTFGIATLYIGHKPLAR
jgi:demethylmenaquinone methyltransferase/2-methoxy-6-polyprenyl-1,4-benzoquinol methylase